ncbi:MAG TPA: hypothetical protein VMW16_02190 [Sedimentisphaerales bacterium]|nr:hypothetical protein [Sedimentisphaerales bacterium]
MNQEKKTLSVETPLFTHLARMVLVTFLLTFISARVVVFLIMSRSIPDLYLHLGGTHIHHLNYGIFLLSAVGGYLLLGRPTGRGLRFAALIYGIAMALTFDEFGMWIRLGGSYWQRASWDAVIVLAAAFALIAFAPSLKRFRPRHWLTTVVLLLAAAVFFFMLVKSFRYAGKIVGPKIHKVESTDPG